MFTLIAALTVPLHLPADLDVVQMNDGGTSCSKTLMPIHFLHLCRALLVSCDLQASYLVHLSAIRQHIGL